MSEQTSRGTVLVAIAAVHSLLASQPELALLPLRWTFEDPKGITIGLPYDDPLIPAVAEQIAAAIGAELTAGAEYERDGERRQPLYIEGKLHGIPVFGSGHAILRPDGGQQ